tara:strand:- start:54 stop:305 length:252 start_codon:yes stop_codon:yes gene_type:complete
MENIEILKLKDRHRIIKEHNFNTMAEVEAYRKAIDDYKSKQLTLTDVVKSDSEQFTPNDVKLPKENKPISMHTDSKKPLNKKV